MRPCILSLSRSLLSIRLTFRSRELSEGFFRRPGVDLQFGTEVEVGRDSSPDCRDFIVLQLLFLLLEVIWKRSPTESSVPVKICNNECKLSISFSCNFSSKKFLESFSYRHCVLFSTKIYSYILRRPKNFEEIFNVLLTFLSM